MDKEDKDRAVFGAVKDKQQTRPQWLTMANYALSQCAQYAYHYCICFHMKVVKIGYLQT